MNGAAGAGSPTFIKPVFIAGIISAGAEITSFALRALITGAGVRIEVDGRVSRRPMEVSV